MLLIFGKKFSRKSINKISPKKEDKNNQNKINYNKENSNSKNIEINESLSKSTLEVKLYGIFDPDLNNFNLNMWASSEPKEIKKLYLE